MFHPILQQLEARLSQTLGRSVLIDFIIFNSYQAGEQALEKGSVDFMRVGPASYVLAKRSNPALQLLAAQKHERFDGAIFTATNSGIQRWEDLKKGKSFAFGDSNSTATVLAKALLWDKGLRQSDFTQVDYRRNHKEVVVAVKDSAGQAAGAAKRTVVGTDMHVLLQFPIVPMPWVAKSNLDPELARALRSYLLELQAPKLLSVLEDGVIGFREAAPIDYDVVERAIAKARLFEQN
jgi:phosphonate transport system substrate-binding protein